MKPSAKLVCHEAGNSPRASTTRMSSQATLVEYYARRAKEYERIYQKPERQGDLRLLRKQVEGVFARLDVLEIACGTGYWTEIVANVAASATATDINEEVLEFARAKPIRNPNIRILKADAHALPFPEAHFTGGLAVFWWSHLPKAGLRRFLGGFHRHFTADAKVVFIDNCFVKGSSTPISRADENGNTHQQRPLDDGSTHEVLKNFPTETELMAAVEGLAEDVRIEFLRHYWILTYRPLPQG
jgi:SAM-dependent methyltransferase